MIVIPKLKKVLLFNTPYMIFFLAVWRIHNLYLILPYPSWLVGLISTVILKIAVYLKSKNAKKYRKDIEYGSARWGTQKDIEPYMDSKPINNIILTETESLTMNSRPSNPKYARNKNVMIIGGSGSGKTRFWLKPNLMQMHSSYVITDPKGLA